MAEEKKETKRRQIPIEEKVAKLEKIIAYHEKGIIEAKKKLAVLTKKQNKDVVNDAITDALASGAELSDIMAALKQLKKK